MLLKAILSVFSFGGLSSIMAALSSIIQSLSPLVRGVADSIVVLGATIWEGVVDILDNWKTIITVALMCFASGYYSHHYYGSSCKQQIENLRKDYKFIPRKKAIKQENTGWRLNKWSPL